jgi:hypothetical protein
MSDSAQHCRASSDGQHLVTRAHAEPCHIDDRLVDVDLDLTCSLCGVSGHVVVSAPLANVDWEDEAVDEISSHG